MSPLESAALAAAAEAPVVADDDEPPSRPESLPWLCPVVPTAMGQSPPLETLPAREPRHEEGVGARGESPRVRAFRQRFFPQTSRREWDDWRWQERHRVRGREQLERYLTLAPHERAAFARGGSLLPFAITPYYLALLDGADAYQGLRRSVIPSDEEFLHLASEADDPLGEERHTVTPGLVHRYPDRVLFLVVDHCATYCRYCTRSRVVGSNGLTARRARWQAAIDYIRRTPSIRDVLLSGGDPLTLGEEQLDWLLGRLREIPHVEFVRLGTKVPAVLPQRITPTLIKLLRRHRPLWMSLHFLHPDECTPETERACSRLADAGIPLGSQTVLLKGVNDDLPTMRRLMHRLLRMRVRPYYLYQCDPISGSHHFRTPVATGLSIIEGLRGHTTGYGVPSYVIDAPGGGGKIPLQPLYHLGHDAEGLLLRNFEGRHFHYPDLLPPGAATTATCAPDAAQPAPPTTH